MQWEELTGATGVEERILYCFSRSSMYIISLPSTRRCVRRSVQLQERKEDNDNIHSDIRPRFV